MNETEVKSRMAHGDDFEERTGTNSRTFDGRIVDSSEQVAVRAETYADELELVFHDAVDQHEVWFNAAVAESGVFPRKRMIVERGR